MDNTEAIAVLRDILARADMSLICQEALSLAIQAFKENEELKAEQDRLHKSIIQIACTGSDEISFKTVPELTVAKLYKRAIEAENKPLPTLTHDKAIKLAMQTDYYNEACDNEGENPINTADAGAFFLEGYEYAKQKR